MQEAIKSKKDPEPEEAEGTSQPLKSENPEMRVQERIRSKKDPESREAGGTRSR